MFSLALCLWFISASAPNTFGLGNDGGGNSGGSLTNSLPGSFPPGSGCFISGFEGLSQINNGLYVFRRPNFSGSTASLLETAFADSSRVSSEQAHSGVNSLKVQWQFRDAVSNPRWLRLTTFQSGTLAAIFPNPALALGGELSFWIYVPTGTPDFYLSAGLRETGSASGCGGNGGTAGAIEWVGATAVRGTTGRAPLGKLISAKDQWIRVAFELPAESVISFVNGNGVLDGLEGVFEHLAVTPVNDTDLGPYTVYLDDLAFGFSSPPTVGNQKWTLTSAPMANWGAAAASADGSRLVAVVQNGPIYISADAGRTWTATGAPSNYLWSAVASSADGGTLIAASFPGPIYISKDSGVTWTQSGAPSGHYWAWVACSADGTKMTAVPYQYGSTTTSPTTATKSDAGDGEISLNAIDDGIVLPPGLPLPGVSVPIYLSADSGTTWTIREPLLSISQFTAFHWTSVAMSEDGSKLAVTGIESSLFQPLLGWYGHVYTSANGGSTWQHPLSYSFPWNWVAMSGDGANMGIAGGIVGTSSDGGALWYGAGLPPGNWMAVATSADGTRMAASEFPNGPYPGRIASSPDSGNTWAVDNAPNAPWNGIAMSADGSLSVAVVYGGGIWVSRIVPVILEQPTDLHLNTGATAEFSVVAESSIGPEYQWLFNGVPIVGQTNATLVLPEVQPGQAGAYSVVVSNAAASVTSSTAFLAVNSLPVADASATPALVVFAGSACCERHQGKRGDDDNCKDEDKHRHGWDGNKGGAGCPPPAAAGNSCFGAHGARPTPDARHCRICSNTNATVVLDASRSSDPDGDPLNYLWLSAFDSQPSTLLATGVVTVVSLPAGIHTIALVVDDGLAQTTNTVTVTVLTAEQAVERLVALVNESGLRHKRPLLASLEAALASIQRGNCHSALGQLHAFQNKVRAQVADTILALELIQSAAQAIEALGGEGSGPVACKVRSLKCHPGGRMHLQFSAPAGRVYVVEASTNLVDWERIGVANVCGDGTFEFEDADAARFPCRFYRVVEP